MRPFPGKLTIFEGPDGSGKTTLAKAYAEATGAIYTHLGPFPRVTSGLARLYVEAMLPAVLRYTDVVMDRCWLSELPYGHAFRFGADRLGVQVRLLERLAWRCETMVVQCCRSWEDTLACFRSRKGAEMLEREDQLREVFDYYATELSRTTSLPYILINPIALNDDAVDCVRRAQAAFSSRAHAIGPISAGNRSARVMLVTGEIEHDIWNNDPLYQWPYGHLDGAGGSHWLADQLTKGGIGEEMLLWVHSDSITAGMVNRPDIEVVALGWKASKVLDLLGNHHHNMVSAPEDHIIQSYNEPYPLIPLLQRILSIGGGD